MTRDQAILLLVIALGAAFLLVHFALLCRIWKKRELSRGMRLLSWLPPATPFLAWKAAERGLCKAWFALGLTYCVLLLLA